MFGNIFPKYDELRHHRGININNEQSLLKVIGNLQSSLSITKSVLQKNCFRRS